MAFPRESRPTVSVPALRILFVDDHSETRHVVGKLLTLMGHHVTTADCVSSALREAQLIRFHLLISDIGLPDGTGHGLLSQMLARAPIVGIAISGYGSEEDVEQSLDGGFAAHLVKPITVAQLEGAIEKVRRWAVLDDQSVSREPAAGL